MAKKKVIAYLHTHWDREWYREFEIFRLRLLRVFDNVLDMLDAGKIPSFYFDGQVCALEDYLEIRPENKERVKKLISEKKLFIGPFYCLVDEYLTDEACFRKNLEIGLKISREYGCTDFIGYLADTFGHSQNVIEILKEYGIERVMVWRGCPDYIPADFLWGTDYKSRTDKSDYADLINATNLVRGYFMDIFSSKLSIEEKAEWLENNLDKIANKSRNYLIMPIGADHLGIETDIAEQINEVNKLLRDYEIELGSPIDYFDTLDKLQQQRYVYRGELRDNSVTFTLQGCYSSRLDLKKYNTECSYKLSLVQDLVKFFNEQKHYDKEIEYAYKLLIKNQAHDSICGCSTDDVHNENITRYRKILQIANGIIDEIKFKYKFNSEKILNLSNEVFDGIIEFKTDRHLPQFENIKEEYNFPFYLYADTQKIPVTEDYTKIYTYLTEVKNVLPKQIGKFSPIFEEKTDLFVSETCLGNSKIFLTIEKNQIKINDIPFTLIDFTDNGDSYNFGPDRNDEGIYGEIADTEVIFNNPLRAILKITVTIWDNIDIYCTLDKMSDYIKFELKWSNTRKNHILQAKFDLKEKLYRTVSEDMNKLIRREFDSEYEIREHLPEARGIEAKTNTAPMQRAVGVKYDENSAFWVITKGLTQYEIHKNSLLITLLRATGVISNPDNSSRSTPAGPPIPCNNLQMLGENSAEFYVYFGTRQDKVLNKIYNKIII